MGMVNFELVFRVHAPAYSIYKLKGVPEAACLSVGTDFVSLSIALNETTLICTSNIQLAGCVVEQASLAWRCLEVVSEHPADVVGLIAFVSNTSAGAGISMLTISSFAGDYFFVKEKSLDHAITVLSAAGSIFTSITEPQGCAE